MRIGALQGRQDLLRQCNVVSNLAGMGTSSTRGTAAHAAAPAAAAGSSIDQQSHTAHTRPKSNAELHAGANGPFASCRLYVGQQLLQTTETADCGLCNIPSSATGADTAACATRNSNQSIAFASEPVQRNQSEPIPMRNTRDPKTRLTKSMRQLSEPILRLPRPDSLQVGSLKEQADILAASWVYDRKPKKQFDWYSLPSCLPQWLSHCVSLCMSSPTGRTTKSVLVRALRLRVTSVSGYYITACMNTVCGACRSQ